MDADPLHVVDLEIEIGLDENLALHDRARFYFARGHAADAHLDAFAPAEAALQEEQLGGELGRAQVALGLALWAKYFVVVLALPLAFFLSVLDPAASQAGPLVYLAYAGAAILALGLFVLGVGLARRPRQWSG